MLVIVAPTLPPYRVHVHSRVARELTEVELWTVITDPQRDVRWPMAEGVRYDVVPHLGDIRPITFAMPDVGGGRIRRAWAAWRQGRRIIEWMRRQRLAAVVVSGYAHLARLRVLWWCRRRGVACFLTADSNIANDRGRGVKRLVKRVVVGTIVRSCSGVLPFGQRGREYFARYGAAPSRMFPFPMEPDYQLIQQMAAAEVWDRAARLGLRRDRQRIIFSGRLIPLKRVDVLLDAFAAVAARRPSFDLVVLGDGPLRERLERSVPIHLADRVVWTGFVSDPADVAAAYRACDVLALQSEYEAWALVVNEAAAAGLAIVCSDVVGSVPELVHDGVNGRVFPVNDSRALAECLLDVSEPERLAGMKAESPLVLAEWRRVGDPVNGLRSALSATGVIPNWDHAADQL